MSIEKLEDAEGRGPCDNKDCLHWAAEYSSRAAEYCDDCSRRSNIYDAFKNKKEIKR